MDSKEIKKIKEQLESAADAYYNSDELIMSDEDFDKLKDKYESLTNKKFSVGSPPRKDKKVVNVSHNYEHMVGTLSKVNTIEEFEKWLNNIEYNITKLLITPKFDGNSICIEYKDKQVSLALTRGRDGKGVDQTDTFSNRRVPYKNEMAVRYEAIINKKVFSDVIEEKRKEKGKDKNYANERSLLAGILSDDNAKKYEKYISLVPLSVSFKNIPISREKEIEVIEKIQSSKMFGNNIKNTFTIIENKKNNNSYLVKEVKKVYDYYTKNRFNFDYMVDGIVIEIMDEDIRKNLGYLNDRPKFSIAFKFPYMEKETKVTGIEFDVSENGSGRITPMIVYEPVYFNGAKQKRTSIANYKRFKELQPINIGSDILVSYRNDVLSYITKLDTENNKKIKPSEFIKKCPVCGSDIVINKNETFAYCSNAKCKARVVGRINNYVSVLDLKGIDYKIIEKLYDAGLLKSISGLYKLDYSKIAELDGFGSLSANNIKQAIIFHEYKDYELIAGLGIENFGIKMAKIFIQEFPLEKLIDKEFISNPDFYNKIININGFSDIMAKKIIKGLKTYNKLLNNLVNLIGIDDIKITKKIEVENQLTFVITGDTKPVFKNRDEFTKFVEAKGHKVVGSVSSKTDFLVNNDSTSNSTKNKKAKELGIKIITVQEAYDMLTK